MINSDDIQKLAIKEQTTEINIAREYLQHLFLRTFYKKKGADRFLFKGGTAIRIIFQGSRYSEDLDFSLSRISKDEIETTLVDTFDDLGNEGITTNLQITDAEPTTGGYIANIELTILDYPVGIKSNIQIKDDAAWLQSESHVITNALFVPSYTLTALRTDLLVQEKIMALIERHKPRDVFDAYFFLRHPVLRLHIPRDSDTLQGIATALELVSDQALESDLKPFLPINFQQIIKQLKTSIRTELGIR